VLQVQRRAGTHFVEDLLGLLNASDAGLEAAAAGA
jgi:hypothetical protein